MCVTWCKVMSKKRPGGKVCLLAGFLSPASRGALLTAMLVSYLLLAVAAGYSSVWLWGMVNHSFEGWQAVAWRCAAYFPGITLLIMSLLNFLIVHTGSSGAIPLGAFFSLLALWFLISIPLCFSGGLPLTGPKITPNLLQAYG